MSPAVLALTRSVTIQWFQIEQDGKFVPLHMAMFLTSRNILRRMRHIWVRTKFCVLARCAPLCSGGLAVEPSSILPHMSDESGRWTGTAGVRRFGTRPSLVGASRPQKAKSRRN